MSCISLNLLVASMLRKLLHSQWFVAATVAAVAAASKPMSLTKFPLKSRALSTVKTLSRHDANVLSTTIITSTVTSDHQHSLVSRKKTEPLHGSFNLSFCRSLTVRGGGEKNDGSGIKHEYEVLDMPAPGSPFHYAFPVHDLNLAMNFYENVLGCKQGRSSKKWQDYSLHGHQIVAHYVGATYRCQDYYNPVDGDEVPVPHTGLALTVEQFQELAQRVREHGIDFIIEPHLRFKDMPGEQYTMFFKDPSGNNLEFKAMTKPQNLFAKYNV